MDGVHDLGGKQGFGPVRYASSRAAFKAAWEPRANALYSVGVRLGLINMDEYRHAIERMEPRHYLGATQDEPTYDVSSGRRICGRKPPTRRPFMAACSRATWSGLDNGGP